MPEILAANVTGLFSYGPQKTIELDNQGLVQLTGLNHDRLTRDANGSGKSSLFNAVCHILYGECPIKGATDTTIVNKVWDHGCWGMVKFRGKNGNQYRLVVSRKWKGEYPDASSETDPCDTHEQGHRIDGTDVYLHEWRDGKWYDIRSAKSAETRADAIRRFGLSYKQFLTTSYLAQQTGLLLVTGTNKERMAIVTELTQMGIWDRAVELLRERLKQKNQTVAEANARISGLQSALSVLQQPLTDDQIVELYNQISSANAIIDQNRHTIAEAQLTLEARVRGRTEIQSQVNDLMLKRNKITEAATAVLKDRAKLQGQRDSLRITPRMVDPRIEMKPVQIRTQLNGLRTQLNGLMSGSGKCSRCGTIVSDEHIRVERAEIQAKIDALDAEAILADKEVMAARDAENKRAHDEHIMAIVDLDARIASLSVVPSTVEIDTHVSNLQLAISTIESDISSLNVNIALYNNDIARRQTALVSAEHVLKTNEANIQQRAKLVSEIESVQKGIEIVQNDIKAINVCIKGMGDKGIKAHKFGTIIAILNEIIKDYIEVLTNGQVQVWFSPFREKANAKSADDVVAEIQIMVKEGPKEEIDVGMYSGAERQEITLAIICAFWQLAMMQNGGTNVLFLDEIFGMLSNARSDLVLALLDKLKQTHYGTIVVVTHSDYVKDQMPYDKLWVAEKRNHISTLRS